MKILLAEHFEMCFGVRDALPSEKKFFLAHWSEMMCGTNGQKR